MRPVCLLMIFFSTLYTTLPLIQLKINLLILLKEPSRKKALLTLHVMTEMHFFTSENPKNIMHGHFKVYVIGCPFCWTTFLFDLAPSCIDK